MIVSHRQLALEEVKQTSARAAKSKDKYIRCASLFRHVRNFTYMSYLSVCRSKMKGLAAKPGRRITLTPLPSQPPSLSNFSAPNSSLGSCWKSNPAFTNHFTSSEAAAPSSLSEERRLLKEERSRRRQKYGSKTTSSSQRDFGIRKPLPTSCNTSTVSARDKSSMLSERGQWVNGQSSSSPSDGRLERSGIDLKIATHSIFEFSSSSHGSNPSPNYSSKMDPSYQNALSGQRSISTLNSISSTDQPPLTSTPLPSRAGGQSLYQVSPFNVAHRDSLDLLSNHYANLIKSESVQWSPSTEDNVGTAIIRVSSLSSF